VLCYFPCFIDSFLKWLQKYDYINSIIVSTPI